MTDQTPITVNPWMINLTAGDGIDPQALANRVIEVLLRAENNLIKVTQNWELYTDLQLPTNIQFDLSNIPVGVSVGRVSTSNWWGYTGTVIAYKTTSGTTNMWLYSDNWQLYYFNGSTFIGIYTAPEIDQMLLDLKAEIVALIPTKTSDLQNDSGFITADVVSLANFYDKIYIDTQLNLKANQADLTAWLAGKVDKSATYEMTNLNLNEQGVMSETFTTQQLAQTMAIIEHALSTLYDGKASAIDTLNALNLKADITYVDNLVWSTLWVSTIVVQTLPVVWQGNYIYLVPISWQPNNYEKYVWNATDHDYVDLWPTNIDLSNTVTLDGAQSITGVKTFTVNPVLPANTASATNTNTAPAVQSQVYEVAQALASFQTSVSNTYATKTELNNAIGTVSGTIGNGSITVTLNGWSTWVTNGTFTTNQWTNQTVNIAVDKSTVGLGNVDNTSDANKPISNATQTALNGKMDNPTNPGSNGQALVKTQNGHDWETISQFSPSNTGTVGQVVTKTADGYEYADAPVVSVNWKTGVVSLYSVITVTLTSAGWSSNTQTVTATGVTASNHVVVSPAPASMEDYTDATIYCTGQWSNSLTFTCDSTPTSAITVNVMIFN